MPKTRAIQVLFRPATAEDAAVISFLRKTIWGTTYRGIYPDKEIDRYDTERHLRRDLARIGDPSYRVYLIMDGDRPIGYLYFQHRGGVHIQSLYVLREYQRCGVGRMAFELIRAYCRAQGLPGFTCNCNSHNQNACMFYAHMGGTVVAEDVGHINLQEDQITYAFPVCAGSSAKNDGSDKSGWRDTIMNFEFRPLTKEDAAYIGEKINEIVPHEVDAEEEEFVLKVENENGEIIGGCIAQAYEYHWSRLFLNELWVDERYRHHGVGSMILREVERIAREKGCRVVTLGTASYMARPFYEKHGYTVFTTVKTPNGFLSYSLVKYLDRDTPEYVPTNNSGARFKLSLGNSGDAEVIEQGLSAYSEAYVHECETVDFYQKLVDHDGRFAAGVIADAEKGDSGSIDALFVEKPLRRKGLGTYLLKEAENFAKENGASMVFTNAGDWNVGFFQKNGYLIRGELKDVPKGHNCYELYKEI